MLSNNGIDVWESFARWVPYQIGERRDIVVAMDWIDFDHDDQTRFACTWSPAVAALYR